MALRTLVLLFAAGCGGERPPQVETAAPARSAPAFELDHLWIAAAPGAPERAAFERAGFQVAAKLNQHAGQGTSSVTVELDNGFLELIYADDAVPLAPGLAAFNAQFKKRADWRTSGYSPFGIGVRKRATAPAAFPFPTFKVTAAWMPEGKFMEILTPREMPAAVRLFVPANPSVGPGADPADPAARVHPNQTHRLTAVRVVAPSVDLLPPAARYLADRGTATFDVGGEWLLDVTLDDGARHTVRDLRPTLPMMIHY